VSTKERIAKAVNDEAWQEFRISLKGLSTRDKLAKLHTYFESVAHQEAMEPHFPPDDGCDVCVRIDNYIKALCRAGQLYRGESLESMIRCGWNPDIKS
jgi:hypothetical protein